MSNSFFGGGGGRRNNLKTIIYNLGSPRFISTNFILLVSPVYWKPASIYHKTAVIVQQAALTL